MLVPGQFLRTREDMEMIMGPTLVTRSEIGHFTIDEGLSACSCLRVLITPDRGLVPG